MATQKAKAATGPDVVKSVTVNVKEPTLEALNGAADVVGAPKDATVALGTVGYIAPTDNADDVYPYQVTFSWSESV